MAGWTWSKATVTFPTVGAATLTAARDTGGVITLIMGAVGSDGDTYVGPPFLLSDVQATLAGQALVDYNNAMALVQSVTKNYFMTNVLPTVLPGLAPA